MERNFSMKKKKPVWPKVVFMGVVLIVGVVAFLAAGFKGADSDENVAALTNTQARLSEKSVTKIKMLYKCGHEKNEIKKTNENLIGKTQKEVEAMNPLWKIVKFSKEEMDVETDINEDCGKHFIIQLVGNEICVYKTNDMNTVVQKRKVNINDLSSEDIKSLLAGIRVDTEYELLEIMESFS